MATTTHTQRDRTPDQSRFVSTIRTWIDSSALNTR